MNDDEVFSLLASENEPISFHFNYLEGAYYHFWRSLELSEYSDTKLLEEFLQI
ncbi:hypothetical protein [Staphylococcus hyicus]|uniref:hypothetical protein n=1 Tax=Staphylococcus hyicus TaxID=1284 RepID=UPI000AFC162F|nr:hypothetical protein [Staphylococcus hyicus]